jgi:MoaA/NifB/PqqE/SkfB family radical SAM enzyme
VLLTPDDSEWVRRTVDAHPHCRTDFDANYVVRGCGALKEIIYVSQYGDVMACPFIQITFGNALERPLAEILSDGAARVPEFVGYAQRCPIAEDLRFIDRYLDAVSGRTDLPVPVDHLSAD